VLIPRGTGVCLTGHKLIRIDTEQMKRKYELNSMDILIIYFIIKIR